MPARQGNNMKYFRRLRTALRIGSEIVPFFHTACLPFMQRSNPAEPNEHQRSTRPPREPLLHPVGPLRNARPSLRLLRYVAYPFFAVTVSGSARR
jgi:hypothetical protein